MPQYAPGLETRQRILEAAAEVFAEQGYRHAKLSEICRRAGANPAAANYHFGDKEQLYLEVMRWSTELAQECASWKDLNPADPPEKRLRQLLKTLMMNMLDPSRPAWQGKLMAREMIEPTPALEVMIEHHIRPLVAAIDGIIGEILGPGFSDEDIERCVASVMGQCVLYHHHQAILRRIRPQWTNAMDVIDELADHITQFSLDGMAGMVRRRRQVLGHAAEAAAGSTSTGKLEA